MATRAKVPLVPSASGSSVACFTPHHSSSATSEPRHICDPPESRWNVGCSLSGKNAAKLDENKEHSVKQIIAILKPFLAEKVLKELEQAPLEALEVQNVKGFGRQKNYLDRYTDSEYSLTFLPKIEIRMWVQASRAEEVLKTVAEVARTGRMGDGKIFVVPVVRFESIQDF